MAEGDYPLSLYREGGQFVWDRRPTDACVVTDGAEHDVALEDGWQEAADYLAVLVDADRSGAAGGSVDAWDQKTDDALRAFLKEDGRPVHHKTGRARMLQILRDAA